MSDILTTHLGDLPIRKALPEDLPALVTLLRAAQAWMDARRLRQWVPGAHDPTLVEPMIRQEILYVVVEPKPPEGAPPLSAEPGRIIATMALKNSLPAHWSPINEPFGYLSTLHVAREYAGAGIGAALVGWGEAALRQQGKVWACLDCYGKNPKLCAYYEAQGYAAISEVETYPGYPERMMQKRLKESAER